MLGGIAAEGVELAVRVGDLAKAELWAQGLQTGVEGRLFYRFLGLAQPRLLTARGEKRAASANLERAFDAATKGGWGYGAIAVRVCQALAAETTEAAVGFLADALRIGLPERFLRAFVDAGPSLVPLLEEAARLGIAVEYVGRILAAMWAARDPTSEERSGIVEPLTDRELEVFRLIAAGLSNRAIAETLMVSQGTVKSHVYNLSRKLSAETPDEAVARGRRLGLF